MISSRPVNAVVGFAIALILMWAAPGHPAPFEVGDVFVTVPKEIKHFSSSLVLKDTYLPPDEAASFGLAFGPTGDLFVARFGGMTVTRFSRIDGSLIGPFGSGYQGFPESLVFDKAGNLYVGVVIFLGEDTTDGVVQKFSSAGTPLGSFDVAVTFGADWIDLAADQKTLFYTSEGRTIFRFDVSTNTQLANFATLAESGTLFAMRILPDGGVLAADYDDIVRLDGAGNVIKHYDVPGEDTWFALTLDVDGTSFWSGGDTSDTVYKFDIATGAVLDSVVATGAPMPRITGLAVFGGFEQRVPAPGALVLVGAGLVGAALWRRPSGR